MNPLKIVAWSFLLVILFSFKSSSFHPLEIDCVVSTEEQKLFQLINEYRASKKLPPIPLSKSLSYVAQTHCEDIIQNHSDQGSCNLHSWSKEGIWTSCCYTPDHRSASCMWNKPRELTTYSGDGFEIGFASYGTSSLKAEEALLGWKKSVEHNKVIVNTDIWKKMSWQAIGIGIRQGYAMVWFGAEKDPAGSPTLAKN